MMMHEITQFTCEFPQLSLSQVGGLDVAKASDD